MQQHLDFIVILGVLQAPQGPMSTRTALVLTKVCSVTPQNLEGHGGHHVHSAHGSLNTLYVVWLHNNTSPCIVASAMHGNGTRRVQAHACKPTYSPPSSRSQVVLPLNIRHFGKMKLQPRSRFLREPSYRIKCLAGRCDRSWSARSALGARAYTALDCHSVPLDGLWNILTEIVGNEGRATC